MSELRLGLLGISEGNGHPYSWAAIVNGYDEAEMARCPFPAIPRYLAEHRFPDEAIDDARVTHLWTQDPTASRQIAAASMIEHIVSSPEEMVGEVDAVLLARDDAERHEERRTVPRRRPPGLHRQAAGDERRRGA